MSSEVSWADINLPPINLWTVPVGGTNKGDNMIYKVNLTVSIDDDLSDFLIENEALDNFITEKVRSSWSDFKGDNTDYYIIDAFDWEETEQGYDYWDHLSTLNGEHDD